jgi:phage repressor protein C with HTH and peptisase S24 domain
MMEDLFPQAPIPGELFRSRRIRILPVLGDSMEPTLRGGRDYVAVVPIDRYTGEGLYVIDINGVPNIRRVQARLRDTVSLIRDNSLYGATAALRSDDVPCEWFLERVIGKVAAEIKVREAGLFAA